MINMQLTLKVLLFAIAKVSNDSMEIRINLCNVYGKEVAHDNVLSNDVNKSCCLYCYIGDERKNKFSLEIVNSTEKDIMNKRVLLAR